jgi:RNA polymerase sigma-70 factor (ECF subfamily)
LFSILNNCWRDHLRARRDFLDVSELDEAIYSEAPGPEQHYASRQAIQRVRQAIARLPIGQRQVITLVDIEECAYADVARILDVPVGTIMSRLSRARQALKEQLSTDKSVPAEGTDKRAVIRRIK